MTPGSQLAVNTLDYTTVELLFFATGGLAWALAYVGVLREIVRNRYVEIPAAACCANIAWELNWGILHRTDLGWVFAWGYRAWFFLDVFIVLGLLRYGTRHLATPPLARVFRATTLAGIAGFSAVIYLLVESGADTSNGLVSGYMVTLMMSALYVPQFFRETDRRLYSPFVAWCKLLGNGLVIGFCVLAMPEKRFLLALCLVTLVLDVYYVLLFHSRRAPAPAAA